MTYIPRKKVFIDFKTLSPAQLRDLSTKWEKDAFHFEAKLDRLLQNVGYNRVGAVIPEETQIKIEKLWNTGKLLWNRLSILETWRIRNEKKRVNRS